MNYKYTVVSVFIICSLHFLSCNQEVTPSAKAIENTCNNLEYRVKSWSDTPIVPDSAINDIEKFYRLSEQKKDYRNMSVALKAYNRYYTARNNFTKNYQSTQKRIEVAHLSGDSLQLYDAIYCAGKLHFSQGTFLDALDYFLQIANWENITTNQRVSIFYVLGQTYSMLYPNNHELEQQYYQLAVDEMNKPDFTREDIKGFILFGEGNLYLNMNDQSLYNFTPQTPQRIDSLHRAVALLKESITYKSGHITDCAIAIGYALLGEFDKAHLYEQKAINFAEKAPDCFSTVNYIRGIIKFREKHFQEAINISKEGLNISLANGKQSDGSKNADVLVHAYKEINDYPNAYKYLQLQLKMEQFMQQKEKQNQMMVYQIKYDTKLKDELLQNERKRSDGYRTKFLLILGGAISVTLILVVFISLYRQKRSAYRELVRRTQEWARTELSVSEKPIIKEKIDEHTISSPSSPEKIDLVLFDSLRDLFQTKRAFCNSDITLDQIARQMGVNRSYLSQAVNRCTGKNFNSFINEYRIKEAVRIMSDDRKSRKYSIDSIAFDSGFNDRKTFYRTFKKITGLSPTDFRNNLQKND